jgi:hypothetical protein
MTLHCAADRRTPIAYPELPASRHERTRLSHQQDGRDPITGTSSGRSSGPATLRRRARGERRAPPLVRAAIAVGAYDCMWRSVVHSRPNYSA